MIVQHESMMDYLTKVVHDNAEDPNARPIKYIALTKSEWDDLCDEDEFLARYKYKIDEKLGKFLGIDIVGIGYHTCVRKEVLENADI